MLVNDEKNIISNKGRDKTDKSLSAERAKADETIDEQLDNTEQHADKAVSKSRAKADKSKKVARLGADGGRKRDERIRLERQQADGALEEERRQMDSVREKERKDKKAAQDRRFQSERKETDQNLTDERNESDSDALSAAGFLSDERSSHVVTKAALTTRDEFLAIVSHDLRNPLGAISMATELLLNKIGSSADEETQEYLHLIERNANEAVRLIADLMDMEQIAAGKLGLKITRHNLGEIIQNAAKSSRLLSTAKNLSLTTLSLDSSVCVNCDHERILQVLSNIVGNAIKFTPDGGAITISASSGLSEAQISVSDTGPGISEDMQKIVFERFWQIGKHDRRGLGLGLYISKMIVENHGGRIWVDSKIGHGSVFHFTVPLCAATSEQ